MEKHGFRLFSKIEIKYVLLLLVVAFGIVIYALNATKSGIWYDEGVEYFYSKFMTGAVPDGFGTANMLERIRITFQPPLYNVLMYLWLSVFDSEFAFRFAGILVTMAGSVGCFFAIDEALKNTVWSIIGTLFFIFTPSVVYYGLECAEYNLMLCFLSWMTYFFIRTLKRKDLRSIIGFFAFATLSIYSQYGAAFIIVGIVIAIAVDLIAEKSFKAFKQYVLSGIVTVLAFVVPLVVFFLAPQMSRQGSVAVSHAPFFEHGFLYDFFIGAKKTLASLFGTMTVYIVLGLALVCLVALILKPKKMIWPILAVLITWVIYFAAVCCSFYGYNYWVPESIGSMNLGDRYSLFLVPAIVVLLVMGIGVFTDWIAERSKAVYRVLLTVFSVVLLAFCAVELHKLNKHPEIKEDVREAVDVWFESEAYREKTLLHVWNDATFHFYLTHDDRYDAAMDEEIEGAGLWIRLAEYDEMKEKLGEMGYLSENEFYYMTPKSGSYKAFRSVMEDAGFRLEPVYSGKTLLLHVVKD